MNHDKTTYFTLNIPKKLFWVSFMAFVGVAGWQVHQRYVATRFNAPQRAIIEQRMANFSLTNIIARCKKEHGYSDEDMSMIEKELKRYFLMIALRTDKKFPLNMYSKDIDNLWHAFILFSKEYHDFSQQICGHYIHHAPNLDKDREKTASERLELQKEYRNFILYYEEIFNEAIHPLWLLDTLDLDTAELDSAG